MSLDYTAGHKHGQHGGTLVGIIVGLLIGLALALGVALYIAKVPVPFVDKVPHRTPEQDAAEAERNKNWDPNAPLAGKQTPPAPLPTAASAASDSATAAKPVDAAASATAAAASAAERRAAAKAEAAAKAASEAAAKSARDPAAILAGQMPASAPAPKASAPAKGNDPFVYFVQAGAFSSADDAEQQRAKLAILGIGTKVTEREQGGRTVYRVRLGPFDTRDEAEGQQDKLKGMGTDAALVRVDRPR